MRILELEAAGRAQAAAAAASISRAADNSDVIQNALDLAREHLQQKTDELACWQVLTKPPPLFFAFSTAFIIFSQNVVGQKDAERAQVCDA